mmetsp:Transcript_18787/g.55098  ORF Transcript_18787/g.55098 Transcript_18787/m.55098 type:complete len:335 (+) Transcript_18787:1563-2567(+)
MFCAKVRLVWSMEPSMVSSTSSLLRSTCALAAKSLLLIMQASACATLWLSRSATGGPSTRKTKRTGGGLTPSSCSVISPRSTAVLKRTKAAACCSRKLTVPASTSHASSSASRSSALEGFLSLLTARAMEGGSIMDVFFAPGWDPPWPSSGSDAGGVAPSCWSPPPALDGFWPPLLRSSLSRFLRRSVAWMCCARITCITSSRRSSGTAPAAVMSDTMAEAIKCRAARASVSCTSRSMSTVPRCTSLRRRRKSWNFTVDRCARPNCISPSLPWATLCSRPSFQCATSRHSTVSSSAILRSSSISTKMGLVGWPAMDVPPMSPADRAPPMGTVAR